MAQLPPLNMDQIINILYAIYYFVRELISDLFEWTIFKNNPDLAILYSDAFTILISLTAIYLILEIFTAAKKFIKYLLIIGWLLLIISIVAGMV
jgi:hypothetical protein